MLALSQKVVPLASDKKKTIRTRLKNESRSNVKPDAKIEVSQKN